MNKTMTLYETITFPIAALGYVWYFIIETPIFVGRMKAHQHLVDVAQEEEYDKDQE